jgi:hypothetical protein
MAMRIHQPIPETAGRVATPDGTAQVMPYQIVVMVTIAGNRVIELPSDAPRFPAVLDTGNNHNFAVRQEQLSRWTGLTLPKRGLVNVGGRTIPLYAANVWIHPEDRDAFRLLLDRKDLGNLPASLGGGRGFFVFRPPRSPRDTQWLVFTKPAKGSCVGAASRSR